MRNSGLQKIFQWLIAIIAWVALILQFYLMMQNRVTGITETSIRFFSFFTILTNIIVGIAFTILGIGQNIKGNNFFSKPFVITAVTVYIFIVGLVYNIVLRSIWDPQGLQLYVDEALHVVTPVLCLVYWGFYVPGRSLKWKEALYWLWYPLIYLTCVLIRGALSNFYPYFFINVKELGYRKVFMNSIYVTLAFLIVALLMIWLNRCLNTKVKSF